MITHLVFDFGGVILDLDGVHTGYPRDLSEILQLPLETTTKLWTDNKTLLMEGKETPHQFLARVRAVFSLDFKLDEALEAWERKNSISRDRIDWQLLEYLSSLKARYHLHMLTDQIQLSNGAEVWIEEVTSVFENVFRSYEQGVRKPFPAAYQNLLTKIEALNEPGSVIFIDDNQDNIDAANKAGINGMLYTFRDHRTLKSSLKQLGVS